MFNERADTTSNSASVYLRQIPRAPGNWSHNECPLIGQTEENPIQTREETEVKETFIKRSTTHKKINNWLQLSDDHTEEVDHRHRGSWEVLLMSQSDLHELLQHLFSLFLLSLRLVQNSLEKHRKIHKPNRRSFTLKCVCVCLSICVYLSVVDFIVGTAHKCVCEWLSVWL